MTRCAEIEKLGIVCVNMMASVVWAWQIGCSKQGETERAGRANMSQRSDATGLAAETAHRRQGTAHFVQHAS